MLNYAEWMLWPHNIFLHKILVNCSHCHWQSSKKKQVKKGREEENRDLFTGQGRVNWVCSELSAPTCPLLRYLLLQKRGRDFWPFSSPLWIINEHKQNWREATSQSLENRYLIDLYFFYYFLLFNSMQIE